MVVLESIKHLDKCASFSYCTSKNENHYGFAGHLTINLSSMITGFTFATTNADERDVAPELTVHYQEQGVNLQTPLQKNMKDDKQKSVVKRLMNQRRKIETIIGQLSRTVPKK